MHSTTTHRRGFTLIELLVVISIIGVLSSIITTSLNGARIKARNTTRISEVIQLRTAFTLARNGGAYPNVSYPYPCITASCYGTWSIYAANATTDAYLAPYIKKSIDPSDNGARGLGGFIYLTPASWAGGGGFPAAYYITYSLELGANDCGPGAIYATFGTFIQCLLRLDL